MLCEGDVVFLIEQCYQCTMSDYQTCLKLVSQLKKCSQSENAIVYESYLQTLNENENDIVKLLGGLDNLLQYCLSDEKFVFENLNDEKLTKLQDMFDINNIDTEEKCNTHTSHNQNFENDTNLTVINVASRENSTTNTINSINVLDVDNRSNQDAVKIAQYRESSQTYLVNIANSFYFEHFSIETATKLYYQVALNKKIMKTLLAIILMVAALSAIFRVVYGDENRIGLGFLDVGNVTGIMLSINLLLVLNYDISKLVMQTFEFWFKLYNLLTIIITFLLYEYYSLSRAKKIESWGFYPWFHYVLLFLSLISGGLCVFLLDAINVTSKNKMRFCVMFSMGCSLLTLYFFCTLPNDAFIDPVGLGSNYTTIGLKNVRIGACINLSIFAAKPLYRELFYCLVKRECLCNNTHTNTIQKRKTKDTKAQMLYQRPYLRW